MPLTTATAPPAQTDDRPFRLRDMFFPEKLLERTNWRDDPLVHYRDIRASRGTKFILTRLLELILFLYGAAVISFPFKNFHLPVPFLELMPGDYRDGFSGDILHYLFGIRFVQIYQFMIHLVFVYLLLRYHLLINDQSNHMKTLSREKLGELLLTRLGNNEYFLHSFLLFCLRYRVLVAWAAIWAVTLGLDALTQGYTWIQLKTLGRVVATLNIVMFTWVLGVYQYVTEWKWFAGGHRRALRKVYSLLHSLLLSAIALAVIAPWLLMKNIFEGFTVAGTIFVLPIAIAVTYLKGRKMNAMATEWLAARYHGESVEFANQWIKPFDPFSPWRWKSPFGELQAAEKSRWPAIKTALICLPYACLFWAAVETGRAIQGLNYSGRRCVYSFVAAWMGITFGYWIKKECLRQNVRFMYLRALWWVGIAWAVLFASFNGQFLGEFFHGRIAGHKIFGLAGILFHDYSIMLVACLAAFVAGALWARYSKKIFFGFASVIVTCLFIFLLDCICDYFVMKPIHRLMHVYYLFNFDDMNTPGIFQFLPASVRFRFVLGSFAIRYAAFFFALKFTLRPCAKDG